MNGRIWVVEYKTDRSRQGAWYAVPSVDSTRSDARWTQWLIRNEYPVTRVVQYVRQGGAR